MARFENPPIDRHEALQPLSRDHYGGLVQAQRLIRGAEGDAAARRKAVAGFLDAWNGEIAVHFEDEERLLPPLMREADRQRMEREHANLRRLAAEAGDQRRRTEPEASWLREAGEALRDHVRWEERQLFQHIEADASERQLADLVGETEAIERSRPRNACPGPAADPGQEDEP